MRLDDGYAYQKGHKTQMIPSIAIYVSTVCMKSRDTFHAKKSGWHDVSPMRSMIGFFRQTERMSGAWIKHAKRLQIFSRHGFTHVIFHSS